MGCPKLTYHLTAEPRLRCVYNAADEEENHVVAPTPTINIPSEKPAIWRIYTADDEQPRLYVPEYRLYIICEEVAPGVYRYTYCLNNPLIYTDPSGEIIFTILAAIFCPPLLPIAICADIFSTGNVVTHAIRGDINNPGDFLKYYGQGALTGAAIGAAFMYAPVGLQKVMMLYGKAQLAVGGFNMTAGLIDGVNNGDWTRFRNAGKLFLGNFYLDENDPGLGICNGILRHTWEIPQTFLGHTISQAFNFAGYTEKVEYWGGVTFGTNSKDGLTGGGISLGNFINVNVDSPYDNFNDYILRGGDYGLMHEYGHTFDSRYLGPLYLPIVGLPSLKSASSNEMVVYQELTILKHNIMGYERSANRHAKRYFRRFGVVWNERRYPTYE